MAELQKRVFHKIRRFLSFVINDQKVATGSLDHCLLSAPDIPKELFVPALDHLVNQLTKIKSELETLKSDPPTEIEEIPSSDNGDTYTEIPQEAAQTNQEATMLPQFASGGQKVELEVDSSMRKSCIDKNLIQITANKAEIDRRIAAFIEQKRLDVDEENKREFCSEFFPYHMEKEHCARTGAVFVPRFGTRSHVTVSRIENINGPQLHIPSSVPSFSLFSKIKQETENPVAVKQEPSNLFSGVEERVSNMASHLHIEYDSKKSQVFDTLKQLEKRILFLESLSPEYFEFHNQLAPERKRKQFGSSSGASRSENHSNQDLSMWEINHRMKALRESLKQKRMRTM
ncbi:MAP3K12-binding inhibitory protein 1 [Octopus sinensis]|uniref:MAP3K12-binding inhibitory protein 1 n=1 Tax=Octopus sinensis TaxID=2607531 RepID=A0A6P7TRV1_9MOLL|nr:MAP3K12-binding inhibitory protein 1 [Octopus sinensis]